MLYTSKSDAIRATLRNDNATPKNTKSMIDLELPEKATHTRPETDPIRVGPKRTNSMMNIKVRIHNKKQILLDKDGQHGMGHKGKARHGRARREESRNGAAWHGSARETKARRGMTWHGTARQGMARHGHSTKPDGTQWHGTAWHGTSEREEAGGD